MTVWPTSLKSGFVDMGHTVIYGMPCGPKTALDAVWVIRNNVDAGNLDDGSHREVLTDN